MKDYWARYKFIIITVIIILVIAYLIYYFGKKKGSQYTPQNVNIPPDLKPGGSVTDSSGNIIPVYTDSNGQTFNPGPYTDAIYADLSCYFCLHTATPYQSAMALSNAELATVYNDWNQRYAQKMSNETLIQAIQGDFTIWNTTWATSTGDFIVRLKSLTGTQG